MTIDEEIRLGERAAVLMDDATLKLAINNLVEDCITRWRNSPAKDHEGREKIWHLLAMSDAVIKELERFVSQGKMAKAKIDEENRLREAERRIKQETADRLGIRVEDFIEE